MVMFTRREWRRDAASTTAVVEGGREPVEGRGRSAAGDSAVHDFAATVARATVPEEVRRALEAAVQWTGDGAARLSFGGGPTGKGLAVPVRIEGGRAWGWIEFGRSGIDGDSAVARRLETVAALAALAFDRLDRAAAAVEPSGPPSLHDATLLGAVLPFALAQARRHKEPLSILLVAIDQLRGVRDLLGRDEADRLVARVGIRIVGLLRSSDLVGRLDDDRLMAILPRAELPGAIRVGEKIAAAVAADVSVSGLPLGVTLSVGAAETPGSAATLGGLLDAADEALSRARRRETSPTAG